MQDCKQIDTSEIQMIFEGDNENLRDYYVLCTETLATMYQAFLQSIAEKDFSVYRNTRHSIRPTLEIVSLSDFIKELEEVNEDDPNWTDKAKKLATEFNAVIDAFREEARKL